MSVHGTLHLCSLCFTIGCHARANSLFWTRALNIPLPHSYVFPQIQENKNDIASDGKNSGVSTTHICMEELVNGMDEKGKVIFG